MSLQIGETPLTSIRLIVAPWQEQKIILLLQFPPKRQSSSSWDQYYKTIFAVIEQLNNQGNILMRYFRH